MVRRPTTAGCHNKHANKSHYPFLNCSNADIFVVQTKLTNMKKDKIIFWVSTTLIFVFEGVLTALFSQKPESKLMMVHLGYPAYFGIALDIFKVLGSIAIMIPVLPKRLIELAYAGFVFDFIFADISNTAVDGVGAVVLRAGCPDPAHSGADPEPAVR